MVPDSRKNAIFQALWALEHRDFQTAFPVLKQAASQGDPDGCFYLGRMYLLGDYVHQSDYYAFCLVKKAASQNHAKAQRLVSEMYEYGRGCEVSKRKALLYLTKASRQGCAEASMRLAEHYINGEIVKRNYNFALYWLRSNKPVRSLSSRILNKECIDLLERDREVKRDRMLLSLYLSFVYWRLIKPSLKRVFGY